MRMNVARQGTTLWQDCADLATERYAADYDARITPSPDSFVALVEDGPDGPSPLACAGLTYGARPLFIEHYFGCAPHELLTRVHGCRVDAQDLVEVGPLASRHGGAGLQLVKMLPALCWCNGARFLLCTVTEALATALARVRIEFVPLATAGVEALPPEQREQWGSYYATAPRAGYIDLRGFDAVLVGRADRGYHLSVSLTGSLDGTAVAAGAAV